MKGKPMSARFEGKVALVSGGARGMGASHVRGFVSEASSVVIGDVLADEGKRLAADLGPRALFVELDVTNEQSWADAVRAAETQFGGLDILVNNAGVAPQMSPIVDTDPRDFRRVLEVNATGVFLGMRAAVVAMARRAGGSIVNISSVAGLTGGPMAVSYVSSKWAVRGMTKAAATEFSALNIRVNSVHPGYIRTPMFEQADADLTAVAETTTPMERVADPDEVTRLVLFLASEEVTYSTGSEFVVDGGLMSGLWNKEAADAAAAAVRAKL
jgi:3alpha(or 20beta)-hydroxysteroid dehydrogenase